MYNNKEPRDENKNKKHQRKGEPKNILLPSILLKGIRLKKEKYIANFETSIGRFIRYEIIATKNIPKTPPAQINAIWYSVKSGKL